MMILLTVKEACKLLRRHDTLEEGKVSTDGIRRDWYHSLSESQAKNIAALIEQMDARLQAIGESGE